MINYFTLSVLYGVFLKFKLQILALYTDPENKMFLMKHRINIERTRFEYFTSIEENLKSLENQLCSSEKHALKQLQKSVSLSR